MCVAKKEGLTEPIVLEDMCAKCRKSIGIIKEDENLTKKLLGYTLSGALSIGAYALTAHLKRNRTEKEAGKYAEEPPRPEIAGFTWISYDPAEEEPLFAEGDVVHLFNPYIGAIWVDSERFPIEFKVAEVKFDESEGRYRYKLAPNSSGSDTGGVATLDEGDYVENFDYDRYYSENWLQFPEFESASKKADELAEEAEDAEQAEAARKFEIDYHLAWLHDAKVSGDSKAYAEAEAELKRLTGKEGEQG